MVSGPDLEQDLAAMNPVPETSAAEFLPPDVNEMVVRQIVGSRQRHGLLSGFGFARVAFLGVLTFGGLASLGLVALVLNLSAGTGTGEIAPAVEAAPADDRPTSTTAALIVGPETTITNSAGEPDQPTKTQPADQNTDESADQGDQTTDPAADPAADAAADPATDNVGEPVTEQDPTIDVEIAGCFALGNSLTAAVMAYDQNCSAPRVDCDPIEEFWVCASEQIGIDSPTNP